MKKVFIIHGWTYSLDLWQGLCDELKTRGIEAVQLKVPGLTEKSDKVWDIDGYIEWLKQQLQNEQQPVVIGHSNGGRIALAFDQKYPKKLGKLILIDSAGVPTQTTRRKAKLGVLRIIAKLGKPLAAVKPLRSIFYKLIGARDYLNAPPNMRLTMQNMLAADTHMNFSAVTVPITMIWGKHDTITPLTDGQRMQQLLGNPPLHVIDDARHAPFSNHAAEVAAIIAEVVG